MTAYYYSKNKNGFITGKRFSIDQPSATFMAHGLAGDHWRSMLLADDGEPDRIMPIDKTKPPYRVPLISEIREIEWNGFTVASTFAGAGGSSTGYRMAGFRVGYANEFVPIAQESYRANCAPYTFVDGRDVKTVKGAEILERCGLGQGDLDVFDGSPPCFPAGVLILARDGMKPIEQVKIGDVVLTHRNRWRRVTATFQRRAATVIVKGQGHPGLRTTHEHPFWCRRLGRSWNNSARRYDRTFDAPKWVKAGDLGPDRKSHHQGGNAWFWSAPTDLPPARIPPIPVENKRSHVFEVGSAEFMWIVGAWLGDGWLRTGKTIDGRGTRGEVLICCDKRQAAELEHRLSAAKIRFSSTEERTTRRFLIASKPFAAWLEKHFGRYSDGKRVPAWALGMSEASRRALLDGYLFADGHAASQIKGGGRVSRITTINKDLAVGARLLAGTLGKSSTIIWNDLPAKTIIEGREVNQRGFYQVTIYERSRSAFADGGMMWGKVRSVRETGAQEDVFNFEVEQDNSYVADGIVVHNCQAFSTAGRREKGWGSDKVYEHGASQKNEELFFQYIRLRDEMMPRAFVAENVSGLVKGTAKGFFIEIMRALRKGYRVEARLLDAQWLGVPQARQRIIIVGVREDLEIDPVFPKPLSYRYSVRDALPWLTNAVHDDSYGKVRDLSDRPAPTVRAGRPGTMFGELTIVQNSNATHSRKGERRSMDEPSPTLLARRANFELENVIGPETDISEQAIGREYDKLNPGQQSDKYFSLVRADAERPSPTITAAGGQNAGIATVVHPTEKRKFTIPEVKRLCSFPDDFELKGTYGQQWERLGNSVPPVMMRAVAETIRDGVLIPARAAGRIGQPPGRSPDRSTRARSRRGAGR